MPAQTVHTLQRAVHASPFSSADATTVVDPAVANEQTAQLDAVVLRDRGQRPAGDLLGKRRVEDSSMAGPDAACF